VVWTRGESKTILSNAWTKRVKAHLLPPAATEAAASAAKSSAAASKTAAMEAAAMEATTSESTILESTTSESTASEAGAVEPTCSEPAAMESTDGYSRTSEGRKRPADEDVSIAIEWPPKTAAQSEP